MKLLLLSNSTNHGEDYLAWPAPQISEFLGSAIQVVTFVPFAAVTLDWDEYYEKVRGRFTGLGYRCESVHQAAEPGEMLNKAEAIVVGGGNTFQLLKQLQDHDCLDPIRERVHAGCPYIGWSAGSTLACPTIMTTNDMPVVQPRDFVALNLVPFQINPHYTEAILPNHGGESRDMRIQEYIELNSEKTVLGIPEGCSLWVQNGEVRYRGKAPMKIFRKGFPAETATAGNTDLAWLMRI